MKNINLDSRVVLEEQQHTCDAYGGFITLWDVADVVWAALTPVTRRSLSAVEAKLISHGMKDVTKTLYRVVMRDQVHVTGQMRVIKEQTRLKFLCEPITTEDGYQYAFATEV